MMHELFLRTQIVKKKKVVFNWILIGVTMITRRVPIETLWPYSRYCHGNHWCIEISAGHDVVKKHSYLFHVPYK